MFWCLFLCTYASSAAYAVVLFMHISLHNTSCLVSIEVERSSRFTSNFGTLRFAKPGSSSSFREFVVPRQAVVSEAARISPVMVTDQDDLQSRYGDWDELFILSPWTVRGGRTRIHALPTQPVRAFPCLATRYFA